jgi:hypothetical protein
MGARTSSRSSVIVMSQVFLSGDPIAEHGSLLLNGIAVPCRLSKVSWKQNRIIQGLNTCLTWNHPPILLQSSF